MSFVKRQAASNFKGRGKTAFYVDTSELDQYIANLKKKSYKGMILDITALTRQAANDIKRAYMPFVPISDRKGASKKYGFTSGNLRRSLGIFKQKQRDIFAVAFSVGFKIHRYGGLASKINRKGKGKVSDGFYGAFVDAGVAGKQKGASETRSNLSRGFRGRARNRVNIVMKQGISQRGMKVLKRRLEKDLLANK